MRRIAQTGAVLAALVFSASALCAQEVRAELSAGSASVGEPVEFTITATGKSQARLADEIAVDGLEVVSNQRSFNMQMGFPNITPRVTTIYRIVLVPTREGEFSIPPLRVELGGKVYKTLPSVLTVSGQSVQMPGGIPVLPAIPVPGGQQPITPQTQPPVQTQPRQNPGQNARAYYGEMVIPKGSAYVGEFIPVDLRFYIDARVPAQFSERPNFSGDGFTVQKFERPSETRGSRDGVDYACVVYRTAITAAKAGPLEIPPAMLDARVQVQSRLPQNIDPFFGNLMQNMPGFAELREIQIPTEGAQIDVKPLPKDGRPPGFDGAIGNFRMEVAATPERTGPGEPVTLRVVVSGRGNFEAMGPPVLVDADGWKVYDPSEKFVPSPTDPTGFNGEKIYEFAIVARQDQKATPSVQFAFFDPEAEKYVTLDGPPVTVEAMGSGATPTPAPSAVSSATATPAPGATPSRVPGDLSRRFSPATFRPAAWSPGFLVAGGILGGLWVAGFVFAWIRRRARSPEAAMAARLRDLRNGLRGIAAPETADLAFLEGVARFVEKRFGGIEAAAAGLGIDDHKILADALAKYESSKFSTAGVSKIDPDIRKRVLTALSTADKAFK